MKREHLRSLLEIVNPVHHKLAGMISNMNLAVEIFDSLSPLEQAKLNQYWQQAHLEAIQHLQESFAYLSQATVEYDASATKHRSLP